MPSASETPATELIWQELRERLFGFIARRVSTPEDAEDILQEVILRIHRHGDELEQVERVTGWIYTIASNAIVDHYRRPARRELPSGEGAEVAELESDSPASAQAAADATALRGELASCLAPLIDRLAATDRDALVLTELGELTQVEAAARLGLSVSGMKSRVQRARARLKGLLLDCCDVELDRRGAITSYEVRSGCCDSCDESGS